MATLAVKRAASSLDVDYIYKKIKLETDSSDISSGEESISSKQAYETATPRDTSDTSNSDVEYDVQSLSDVTVSEVSSGPEDCSRGIVQDTLFSEDIAADLYVADLSDLSDSPQTSEEEDLISTVTRQCTKCKGLCEYPFKLCLKCFRQRKIYMPPRPKGRKKRGQGSPHKRAESFESQSSQEFLGSQASSLVSEGSTVQESNKASLCKCCFSSPVDGVFIHKNSVHPMYCYKCSVKQWRLRGRCAFCNQKLCKVAKIFPVDD